MACAWQRRDRPVRVGDLSLRVLDVVDHEGDDDLYRPRLELYRAKIVYFPVRFPAGKIFCKKFNFFVENP